jgi:hypothetical protein
MSDEASNGVGARLQPSAFLLLDDAFAYAAAGWCVRPWIARAVVDAERR